MHDLQTIKALNLKAETKEISKAFQTRQQINGMLSRDAKELKKESDKLAQDMIDNWD